MPVSEAANSQIQPKVDLEVELLFKTVAKLKPSHTSAHTQTLVFKPKTLRFLPGPLHVFIIWVLH